MKGCGGVVIYNIITATGLNFKTRGRNRCVWVDVHVKYTAAWF